MAQFSGPVDTGEVTFSESNDRREVEVGEFGADGVLETAKGLGTVDLILAVVQNGIGEEKFEDGFAAALVPNFFKPADDEVFVLFLK